MDAAEREAFEAQKRRSMMQVLFKCARLLNEQALAHLRRTTGRSVQASHVALFPHLDFEGIRLTALAERLGISKQAVGQLVDDLERMGTVERVRDPSDGRAKLIRYSRQGQQALRGGVSMLVEMEGELRELVGAERLDVTHQVLLEIVDAVEAGALLGEPSEDSEM